MPPYTVFYWFYVTRFKNGLRTLCQRHIKKCGRGEYNNFVVCLFGLSSTSSRCVVLYKFLFHAFCLPDHLQGYDSSIIWLGAYQLNSFDSFYLQSISHDYISFTKIVSRLFDRTCIVDTEHLVVNLLVKSFIFYLWRHKRLEHRHIFTVLMFGYR